MSDPARTNEQFAEAARKTADTIAAFAREISDQVDSGSYTIGGMIRSMAKLASITAAGGLRFAEAALDARLDDGQMLVADNIATTARRMVGQARYVAEDVSKSIAGKSYGLNGWVRSLTELADIGVLGGLEMAETAVTGPARYEPTAFISDVFKTSASSDDRSLKIDPDNGLKRPGTTDEIPLKRIAFQPPRLKPGATDFYLVVDEENLPSGVYEGTVLVGATERVPVAIRL
jgi:hypothetical protein